MSIKPAAALGLVAAVGLSCLDPTEIVLDVRTDVDCTNVLDTAFFVGNGQVADAPHVCDGGVVGTLVIIPSGVSDHVDIRVVMGMVGSRCDQDLTSGCIEARRALDYVPHRPLDLPILMQGDCLNVACGQNLTCDNGVCVDSTVDEMRCDGGVCPLVDSGVCVADPPGDAGAPIVVFHFDEGMGTTTQDAIHTLASPNVPTGVSWASMGAPSCNSALQFDGTSSLETDSTPLVTPTAGAVTVSAWIKLDALPTSGAFVIVGNVNFNGYTLQATHTGLQIESCGGFPLGGGCTSFGGKQRVDDGAWHFVVGSRSPAQLSVCVDGVCENGSSQPPLGSGGGFMTMGLVECCDAGNCPSCAPPGFSGILDEVHIYPTGL